MRIEELTRDEKTKIDRNLHFISLITEIGKELGLRVVIAGGYAVDAALGQITRIHNDIDIQVYGKSTDGLATIRNLLGEIGKRDSLFANFAIEEKSHKEYYRNLYIKFGEDIVDIYYLQIENNPFDDQKIIVKKDGIISKSHPYDTQIYTLNDVKFEGQDPLTEVVDKIHKREHQGDPKLVRHDQDIENLKQIVPLDQINEKLKEYDL